MTTITKSAVVHTPRFVEGYESARPARTVVHAIIGNSESAVTSRAAGLRTGTLRTQWTTEALASAFELFIAGTGIFALADSSVTTVNMNFLPKGQIRRQLDQQTRVRWWVIFDFVEVT